MRRNRFKKKKGPQRSYGIRKPAYRHPTLKKTSLKVKNTTLEIKSKYVKVYQMSEDEIYNRVLRWSMDWIKKPLWSASEEKYLKRSSVEEKNKIFSNKDNYIKFHKTLLFEELRASIEQKIDGAESRKTGYNATIDHIRQTNVLDSNRMFKPMTVRFKVKLDGRNIRGMFKRNDVYLVRLHNNSKGCRVEAHGVREQNFFAVVTQMNANTDEHGREWAYIRMHFRSHALHVLTGHDTRSDFTNGRIWRQHSIRFFRLDVAGNLSTITRQFFGINSLGDKWLPLLLGDAVVTDMLKSNDTQFTQTSAELQLPKHSQSVLHRYYNKSQFEAIQAATSSRSMCTLIKGPPGTGKTRTILGIAHVALFHQYRSRTGAPTTELRSFQLNEFRRYNCRGKVPPNTLVSPRPYGRVLITAPSNAACDEISLRILRRGILDGFGRPTKDIKFVRVGEMLAMNKIVAKHCSLESLRKKSVNSSFQLKDADIICCTLSSCGRSDLHEAGNFTIAIVDESTQATESDVLLLMTLGFQKLVLVGDDKQLRPTIISSVAATTGLNISLFERLMHVKKPHMLTMQYRMHPKISLFPSLMFYENKLANACCVEEIESKFLYSHSIFQPFVFFDVYNRLGEKKAVIDGKVSIINAAEAKFAVEILKFYMYEVEKACSFSKELANKFGIITPYSAQVKHIKKVFAEEFPKGSVCPVVASVDSFQGSEKDFIILSCVRSNCEHAIGFLSNDSRMNVAITRAKRGLWVLGCSQTLIGGGSNTWKAFIAYSKDKGVFINAKERTFIQLMREKGIECSFPSKIDTEVKNPHKSLAKNKHMETLANAKFHTAKANHKGSKIPDVSRQFAKYLKRFQDCQKMSHRKCNSSPENIEFCEGIVSAQILLEIILDIDRCTSSRAQDIIWVLRQESGKKIFQYIKILRSYSDARVRSAAVDLVKSWKREVRLRLTSKRTGLLSKNRSQDIDNTSQKKVYVNKRVILDPTKKSKGYKKVHVQSSRLKDSAECNFKTSNSDKIEDIQRVPSSRGVCIGVRRRQGAVHIRPTQKRRRLMKRTTK